MALRDSRPQSKTIRFRARRRFACDAASARTSVVRSVPGHESAEDWWLPGPGSPGDFWRWFVLARKSSGLAGPAVLAGHVSVDSRTVMTGTAAEQAGDWGGGGAACLRSVSGG